MTGVTAVSSEFFAVSALILLNTSFFTTVGDEHGLTDGVLFAEIVLFLTDKDEDVEVP